MSKVIGMEELYSKLVEEFEYQKKRGAKLELHLKTISKRLKENAVILKRNDLDYHQIVEENCELKKDFAKFRYYDRENEILKLCLEDLSRQVCFLLRKISKNRGNLATESDQPTSLDMSLNNIISKNLVAFEDICSLQENNQTLFLIIREISSKLKELDNSLNNDMGIIRDEKSPLASNGSVIPNENTANKDRKINELEEESKNLTDQIKRLKDDHEEYKKSKCTNDRMMNEQFDKMRAELQEITSRNFKLMLTLEHNNEEIKTLQTNATTYKAQIATLEDRNKNYERTIIQHEQNLMHSENDKFNAQKRLATLQSQLETCKKECAILHDSEARLLTEQEGFHRERQTKQNILSNIEMIKTFFERSQTEVRQRNEERLDEATRECSALRRRLENEQKRAEQIMEEEREHAVKLKHEIITLRNQLTAKEQQIDDLSKNPSDSQTKRVIELSDRVNLLENEKFLIQVKNRQLNAKIDQFKTKRSVNLAKTTRCKQRINTLYERIGEYFTDIKKLRKDNQSLAKSLIAEKSYVKELQNELTTTNQEKHKLKGDIVNFQRQKRIFHDEKKEMSAVSPKRQRNNVATAQKLSSARYEVLVPLQQVHTTANSSDEVVSSSSTRSHSLIAEIPLMGGNAESYRNAECIKNQNKDSSSSTTGQQKIRFYLKQADNCYKDNCMYVTIDDKLTGKTNANQKKLETKMAASLNNNCEPCAKLNMAKKKEHNLKKLTDDSQNELQTNSNLGKLHHNNDDFKGYNDLTTANAEVVKLFRGKNEECCGSETQKDVLTHSHDLI